MKLLVQECCCGCSLRVGSLIVLWLYLAVTLLSTAILLGVFSFNGGNIYITFSIIVSSIGALCSLGALMSIHMNKAYFLTAVYSHMLWVIASGIFFMVSSVCFPTIFDTEEHYSVKLEDGTEDVLATKSVASVAEILLILLCETAGLGLLGYFAIVVKSYRNVRVINHATEAEISPTQEPFSSISMQHSKFLPHQSFTGVPKPTLPSYSELPKQSFVR